MKYSDEYCSSLNTTVQLEFGLLPYSREQNSVITFITVLKILRVHTAVQAGALAPTVKLSLSL